MGQFKLTRYCQILCLDTPSGTFCYIASHETEDDLPRALFRRCVASVLAIRALGNATRDESFALRPRTVCEPNRRFFRNGCCSFRRRSHRVHADRERAADDSLAMASSAGCAPGRSLAGLANGSLHAGSKARTTQSLRQRRRDVFYSVSEQLQSAGGTCASRKSATRL